MGQRLSRAKAKIAAAGIPFAVPGPDLWAERLDSVLTTIYLIFNEGYSASSGAVPLRGDLCEEAVFLARLLIYLRPEEPETEGLLALMLLTHARRAARIAQGALVPLEAQDRRLWDAAMIGEGLGLLDRAMARHAPGPFQIKAAIAALHVQPEPGGGTDWRQIALLYDSLLRIEPTPVVRLNRAVALAESGMLPAALREIEALAGALDDYPQFHAARADLLRRLARGPESDAAYDRAIALAPTSADAAFLRARRSAPVIVQADAGIPVRGQKKAEQTLGPSPTGRYEDNGQSAPPSSQVK
jgi:RNA polymerase sigma-70 factor (ECF subfamily)